MTSPMSVPRIPKIHFSAFILKLRSEADKDLSSANIFCGDIAACVSRSHRSYGGRRTRPETRRDVEIRIEVTISASEVADIRKDEWLEGKRKVMGPPRFESDSRFRTRAAILARKFVPWKTAEGLIAPGIVEPIDGRLVKIGRGSVGRENRPDGHHVTWVWSAFLLECGWARFTFRPHFTHTLASFGSVLGRNTALEARSNPVFVWVLVNRAELTN